MKTICLNAGHTLSGYGSGVVGYINESRETRKVVNAIARYLRGKGHTVIINNVDKADSQSEYLKKVVDKVNENKDVDLFVSIHFNASKGGYGTECYTWKGKKLSSAVGICEELNKYGFRNRGVKDGSSLYVVKNTKMPAVLVEVCFADSLIDWDLYNRLSVNVVAQAITRGILK